MKLLPGWFISENIFLIPSAPKDSYGGGVIKVIMRNKFKFGIPTNH